MHISVSRRQRSHWLTFERQPNYWHVAFGNPIEHRWYAFSLYLFWD